MNEDKIRTYDELKEDENEILDVLRQMKLMSDLNSDYINTMLKS